MKELREIMTDLSFPEEAIADCEAAADLLFGKKDFKEYIDCHVLSYKEQGSVDYDAGARGAYPIAESHGVNKYTGALLFFLALAPTAREFYLAEGYSDALFRASVGDVMLKSIECHKVHGVWGVDTNWFGRFYDRTRFTLGRLQFETEPLKYPFAGLEAGAKVINIHIPELGPLRSEDCLAAYSQAVKAFPECVREGKAVFVCSSWLLATEMRTFMPQGSNILRFADDFTVLHVKEQEGFPDGWRVFADKCKLPPAQLPRDTALRKGYAEHLEKCGKSTVCYGAFLFDTEKGEIVK